MFLPGFFQGFYFFVLFCKWCYVVLMVFVVIYQVFVSLTCFFEMQWVLVPLKWPLDFEQFLFDVFWAFFAA